MKTDNILLDKTYSFALKIVELYKLLRFTHKEYEISKQVLRSGTSIGANAEEGNAGQSKKDFIAKLSISLKEARETHYWIRILKDSQYIEEIYAAELLTDCTEIIRILTSILKTSRQSLNP